MRYLSIDVLRMMAIFVMVYVHFAENLAGQILPIAGLGAPVFAFLSGVSYRLWLAGRERKQVAEEQISRISTRRGLFVFCVGLFFNVIVWFPEEIFNWDVLTFIGAGLLFLGFARKLPLGLLLFIAGTALAISPLLRATADYSAYWQHNYYDPDMTLPDVIIGFTAVGYFPFFPWITYSLVGYVIASSYLLNSADLKLSHRQMTVTGGLLIAVSQMLIWSRQLLPELMARYYIEKYTMFPPTIPYVLGTLGWAILLLVMMHNWLDCSRQQIKPQWAAVAELFSRYAFTIYVLHHLVHLWPMWIYAWSQGQEPTIYWQQALTLMPSLLLATVYLLCSYFLLRWMQKNRVMGIEDAMRWICDA